MTAPTAIIEAVPNFSEGRRPEVVERIVDALRSAGAALLDVSSDYDHNRMVATIAGDPQSVVAGLFTAVGVASELINLHEHRGVHPRIGATDVIPLVPIENISLAECADLARELGRKIGETYDIPVYLYEAAASRPDRRNLADVRRGEFEALIADIQSPARTPDFGPSQVGPAGAIAVGARPFLIAYNFYLQSDDVRIAKAISRKIRESSGGFPAVKAIGLLVNGRAQISMNLVDFQRTPLHVVMDEVSRLAQEHGTAVAESELIGLIPQAALLEVAAHYLKLANFHPGRVVENAIRTANPHGAAATSAGDF